MFSHMILGLLRDAHPRHGYELMTEYRSKSGSQINAGNFYRELSRLSSEGLVQTDSNPRAADARRIPYRITERGCQVFDQWVSTPSTNDDEFAGWLLFVDQVPLDQRDSLLDRRQEDLWLRAKALARAREDALMNHNANGHPPHYEPLGVLISRRMKLVAADLEFVNELRSELERQGAFQPPRAAPGPKKRRTQR